MARDVHHNVDDIDTVGHSSEFPEPRYAHQRSNGSIGLREGKQEQESIEKGKIREAENLHGAH